MALVTSISSSNDLLKPTSSLIKKDSHRRALGVNSIPKSPNISPATNGYAKSRLSRPSPKRNKANNNRLRTGSAKRDAVRFTTSCALDSQ